MADPIDPPVEPQAQPVAESAPATPEPVTTPEPAKETPVETPVQTPTDRTVPYQALADERKKRQEIQRKLAEYESAQRSSAYSQDDLDKLMQHPFVQDLMMKDAKRELTDYTKDLIETQYPSLNAGIKKTILSNVRGFIKESTHDVESAKLDIQEWIESNYEDAKAPTSQSAIPQPKSFPVASTNATQTTPGITPAALQKIYAKPVDEWTDDDMKIIAQAEGTK